MAGGGEGGGALMRGVFVAVLLGIFCFGSASAREVQVMLSAKHPGACGHAFKGYLWIPRAVLPTLGMPAHTCADGSCGAVTIDDGTSKTQYNLAQINVDDGHDVCNACNCDLAYLQLVPG